MREYVGVAQRVPVLSVSDLNRSLRASLETDYAEVWVAGEISNFRAPGPAGHFYFCLKDRRSQIAAVMFRSAQRYLPFKPKDGLDVIAHGRISLYEARGDLQLYVDALEPRGLGGVQLALEQLKQRLAAEGLFDAARKRPLPVWPRAIGVVTARTGAAMRDIVTTLRGRMPHARIIVRAVRVQGPHAGAEIVAALADLGTVDAVEVIIVGRGGGSLEDLWAFNEERVARAIAAARVPVVSAVGHEIDVTLADLAADCRAATPSAAAALVVPDCAALAHRLALRRSRPRMAAIRAPRRNARRWASAAQSGTTSAAAAQSGTPVGTGTPRARSAPSSGGATTASHRARRAGAALAGQRAARGAGAVGRRWRAPAGPEPARGPGTRLRDRAARRRHGGAGRARGGDR